MYVWVTALSDILKHFSCLILVFLYPSFDRQSMMCPLILPNLGGTTGLYIESVMLYLDLYISIGIWYIWMFSDDPIE